jgi:branched-chain amino acid transport system ATP-binding protein
MARVITAEPAVLLLDELSMGLAPRILEQLYEQVALMAQQGVSVLVVEQFAQAVLEIADSVAVMVQGQVVASGKPSEVAHALPEAYLGAHA